MGSSAGSSPILQLGVSDWGFSHWEPPMILRAPYAFLSTSHKLSQSSLRAHQAHRYRGGTARRTGTTPGTTGTDPCVQGTPKTGMLRPCPDGGTQCPVRPPRDQ